MSDLSLNSLDKCMGILLINVWEQLELSRHHLGHFLKKIAKEEAPREAQSACVVLLQVTQALSESCGDKLSQ